MTRPATLGALASSTRAKGISVRVKDDRNAVLQVSVRHLTAARARAADACATILSLFASCALLGVGIIRLVKQDPGVGMLSPLAMIVLAFLSLPLLLWLCIAGFRALFSRTTRIDLAPGTVRYRYQRAVSGMEFSERPATFCRLHDRLRDNEPEGHSRSTMKYYSRTFFVGWIVSGIRTDVAEVFGHRRAEDLMNTLEHISMRLWETKSLSRMGIGTSAR